MKGLRNHLLNVSNYSMLIGIELGFDKKQMLELATAGQFHDIGKLKIPDNILYKPSKLTLVEFEIIKKHPIYSVELIKNRNFNLNIINGVLYHHERWDGSGYPNNLNKCKIPIISRVISIADTYDAITSKRVYSPSKSHEYALKEIIDNSGTQFDPNIVDAFKDSLSNRFRLFNLNQIEDI